MTAVDPDRGQLTRTATVRPIVDPDAIDVVAVLVPRARVASRPEAPCRVPRRHRPPLPAKAAGS